MIAAATIQGTVTLSLIAIAGLLTIIHACTDGKIPLWMPLLLVIIAILTR